VTDPEPEPRPEPGLGSEPGLGPEQRPPRRPLDPLLAVVAGVAVGIVMVSMHRLRAGMYVVAAALAVGALLRLVLRPRAASSLVVRGRQVDVFVLAALAAAIATLAAITPLHSTG
jgi:hypothetical protein